MKSASASTTHLQTDARSSWESSIPIIAERRNFDPDVSAFTQRPIACLRPAVVVSHPGHELRVFGWLSTFHPLVHIITDGSGNTGISRFASSGSLIASCGSQAHKVLDLVPDAGLYQAILGQQLQLFRDMVDCLSDSFCENEVDFVAGDANEGFNPAHDICRELINASVAKANRRKGTRILNYEFCLTEWDRGSETLHDDSCSHFRLDDHLLSRKLTSARNYPELQTEIDKAIASRSEEYFRLECFREITDPNSSLDNFQTPFYESWGEKRVAEGRYNSVIRFMQHMKPIFEAIRQHSLS